MDWLLEAADLPADGPKAWEDAILELYGAAEKEHLLRNPWLTGARSGNLPD